MGLEFTGYVSKRFRKAYADGEARGEARGRAEGEARGEARGRAEGEARGRAEGEAQGRAEAILRLLARRQVAIAAEDEARVRSCTDLDQLDAWFDRALTVTDAAELFEEAAG